MEIIEILNCFMYLIHLDIDAMSVYLCCISCDIKDGYDVKQCFLLCRLCLNELIDSFPNGIDIFCSCSPCKPI